MWRGTRSLQERRVLITGASSGIGRSLALRLARQHARLLLTARRQPRLEALVTEIEQAGGQACYVAGDITATNLRTELIQRAKAAYGGLDILVNNAGLGGLGTFSTADASRLRQIMEVNFFAAVELTRVALPLLRESPEALVVNVGSVLGHCAVPKKSEYCASKFALHGFNDALREELYGEGIDVLLVSPSTTASEFFDHALRSQGDADHHWGSMSSEHVALHILRAIRRRRREIILSWGGKMLVWADRLAPGMLSCLLRRYG